MSDTIVTINRTNSYHIEIQMYRDSSIVMRVFDYGYRHALTNSEEKNVLRFPNPMIVYLSECSEVPPEPELLIDFGGQGTFRYRVNVFRYLDASREELNRRKLITLIPFQLLRLRKEIEKKRTPENMEALKVLIRDDIIGTVNENIAAGNITAAEGQKLKRMTQQLYRHIYEKYDEMEEGGINQMVEEALILDVDIIEYELKKKITKEVTDRVTQEVTEEVTREVTDKFEKERRKKDAAIISLAEKLRSMNVPEDEIMEAAQMTKEQFGAIARA